MALASGKRKIRHLLGTGGKGNEKVKKTMSDINITQAEADILLAMEKIEVDSRQYFWNKIRLEIPLVSCDHKEQFVLDLRQARIDIHKFKYQTRARVTIILARLDFGQSERHINPDHVIIEGPHIHLYRENYADKWAYLLDDLPNGNVFSDLTDYTKTLNEFMKYCNIREISSISRGLFS